MKFGEIGVYTVPETPCITPHGPGNVVQYEVAYDHWVRGSCSRRTLWGSLPHTTART